MPVFAELGLPEPRRCGRSPRARLHRAVPDPGRDPARRARRARPARPRPDRLGQDARLRARDAGPARRRPVAAPPPRGLVLVPTRELAQQVVDALMPYAKALGLTVTVGGRRHVVQPAGRRAAARRRPAGRHARAGSPTTSTSAPATCPRSRSPRSTRPTGWPTWASCPRSGAILDLHAGGRPAAAVLRHPRRRRRHAGPPLPHRPGDPLGRPGHRRRSRRWSTTCCIVDAAAKPRVVTEIAARDGPHDPVRPHQARRRPAGQDAAPRRDRRRRAARRQGAERPQPGDRGVQGRAARRCWWPPTSPPAASTSTT